LLEETFWLRKITTDPRSLSHVNMTYPDDRYQQIKTLYLRNDFRYIPIYTRGLHHSNPHDLNLINSFIVHKVCTVSDSQYRLTLTAHRITNTVP